MNNTITTASPIITFASDPDTGIGCVAGDQITIVAGGEVKQPKNYKKVHVARRRRAKQNRSGIWTIREISGGTLTL